MPKRSIKTQNSRARPKCIDLFAGAGGLSLAAKNADVTVVAAVERNPNACETYRNNLIPAYSRTTLYEKDILDLDPSEVLKNHFIAPGDCDIVLGGPPCQGFSTHRIKGAGIDDPRNALVLRYFEFVAVLRPKVFLMENVPGILWERHKKFIESFYKQAIKAGYDVKPAVVIDARDYGIPQRRKRVFILGVRSDLKFSGAWPPPVTHGNAKALAKSPTLAPWVAAATIFEKIVAPEDENNIHMHHTARLVDVFKSTPPNGGSRHQSSRVLPCHKEHSGHKDVYGRIDPSIPGPTMTTACINPSKGRFVHPTEHHGISLRQAARFQTFPDDFVFHGGLIAAGEQIGNAVPVLLGEILIRAVIAGVQAGSKRTALPKAKANR